MEQSAPNLISSRLDLKRETIVDFHYLIEALKSNNKDNSVSIGSDTKLIILTSFGTISCGITDLDSSYEEFKELPKQALTKVLFEQALKSRNEFISKKETEIPDLKLVNDTSTLFLNNVVIMPFGTPNNTVKMEHLVLFTDQVIGITIGEITR